jgi:hypothetical protein
MAKPSAGVSPKHPYAKIATVLTLDGVAINYLK